MVENLGKRRNEDKEVSQVKTEEQKLKNKEFL